MALNLTYEVRDGILKHSKSYTRIIADDPNVMPETLEGQIVRIADSLAYINHDIDDGLQGGILKQEDLPKELLNVLGYTLGERVGRMVQGVIAAETQRVNLERVVMSSDPLEPTELLRKFLFDHFYLTPMVNREADKSRRIVIELYEYFLEHPEQMDLRLFGLVPHEDLPQLVCDYLACMTDDFALKPTFRSLSPNVLRKNGEIMVLRKKQAQTSE